MTHSPSCLATAYITRFISSWKSSVHHKICACLLPCAKASDSTYTIMPFTPAPVYSYINAGATVCSRRRKQRRHVLHGEFKMGERLRCLDVVKGTQKRSNRVTSSYSQNNYVGSIRGSSSLKGLDTCI